MIQPYFRYRAGQGDGAIRFVTNPAVIQVVKDIGYNSSSSEMEEIQKWYDYALISFQGNKIKGGFVPDLFLFNYNFFRLFQKRDYEILKKKHKTLIFRIDFSSHSDGRARWSYIPRSLLQSVDFNINLPRVEMSTPSDDNRYEKSILNIVPDFLWDTDCLFLLMESHEICKPRIYYEILMSIHDLEKKGVDPSRFIISDNSVFIGEDPRRRFFYKRAKIKFKNKVRARGVNTFHALTASYYSGHHESIPWGSGFFPGEMGYDLKRKRKKKFILLNRISRVNRIALAHELDKRNLFSNTDNFYFSFNNTHLDLGGIESIIDEDKEWTNKFRNKIPIHLDSSKMEFEGIKVQKDFSDIENSPQYFGPTGDTRKILDFARDSYINLVTETDISQYFLFLTEKTFKCMVWKQPFIIWGNPYTLKKLHELGYKTFHPWIDESYDNITDIKSRLKAICQETERICKMDLEEVHNLYQELIPIIEHNYNHFNYERIIRSNYNYMIKEFLPPTPPR